MADFALADPQRSGLTAAMRRSDLILFSAIDTALSTSAAGYHSSDFLDAASDWLAIEPQDIEDTDLQRLAASITDRIRVQAYQMYIEESADRIGHEGMKNRAVAMAMAAWVGREAKRLDKKFPNPIFM